MDTSELHYITFDPDEVWEEMNATYLDAGGDILYGGDEKEILLRAVLTIAVSVMARVDSALRMDTLTYAVRDYLDLYGEKRNCLRIQAEPATAPVRITFQATGEAKTYPANETTLTADGVVIWRLAGDVDYTGYAGTVDAIIECETPGIVGNGLTSGTQLQLIEADNAVVSVIVLETASGGVDKEDDETYRERIRTYGLSSVTTGPSAQYEAKAKAVSTQIIDARALNDGEGEVGIYLILDDDADAESIFAEVEEALSDETTRPLTDHVQVHEADEKTYTLNVEVYYSAYAGIGDAVTAAISEYQTWQDDHIGRAFNPDKLIAMLYQAGCERARYTSGSGMDGSLDYTEIPSNARCKGTITPTVVNA